MKKRIIPLLLCLVLALSVLFALSTNADAATAQETGNAIAKSAQAQTEDGIFPETLPDGQTTYTAQCYACGAEKEWMPLTDTSPGTDFEDGAHYYLTSNTTITSQFQFGTPAKTLCLHTNGKVLTATSRVNLVAKDCTFNAMGGGTLQANTSSGNRGVLYCNNAGTINIYGCTVKNTATTEHANGNACVTMYNTNGVANFWSCNLIGSSVSPSILTNGVVNLYNCTVTGPAAQVGGYADRDDSKAALNLYDSEVSGVDVLDGTVTVSGNTKITGTGLELTAGKTIDPSNLTEGASIAIGNKGEFTPAGMADYAKYFTAADTSCDIQVMDDGTLRCWPNGAVLVASDGTEAAADDVLTEWATGNYAYIKLYGDDTFAMEGQDLLIDLNGFDLTVTGTGNIRAFDSANDTYDKNACGTIVNNGAVTLAEAVAAPNGNRYITVTESNRATAHRLDIKLTSVTLRTTAAGLYYKAKYTCDATLAAKVQTYGVIVSVNNMPGADYANDGTDINKYTVAAAPFQNGVTATSGSIFGIMKAENSATDNDAHAKIPIYANAYIDLGNGPIVADIDNPGKTVDDSDFTGTALSLYNVMQKLDDAYNTYNTTTRMQLDNFYFQWKEKGMDWGFDYIGQTAGTTDGIDNSDLVFDAGTTDAMCPVCKVKVTWTALTLAETHQNLQGHYYLAEDLTFEKTGDAIFFNSTKNTTLCVHLNGHNLTATKTRAVHGSSGRTNIMGNGIVTGYHSTADYGAAVMVNNTVVNQSVHLYGGTYKKTANSNADVSPLCVSNAGGTIVVHEGVTVENPGGSAIIVRTPHANANKQELGLYGCTVNGNVKLIGGDPSVSDVTACVELVDCTVNGNVDVAQHNDVYLAGAPVIKSVTLQEDALLNTKVLTAGASIGIANDGIFTAQSESVKNYITYFHGTDAADVITVRDNALHCGRDYLSDLKFEEGTTNAMCPVCNEVVTWTELTAKEEHQNLKGHYYLAEDQTFTNTGDAFFFNSTSATTLCVHLNGHNLTATKTRVVHGSSGRTNIMGNGVVTGYQSAADFGAAVQVNNYIDTQSVHLYGGTYKKTSDSHAGAAPLAISTVGGEINIYDGVTVENADGLAIIVKTPTHANTTKSKLSLHGGTVNGNIVLQGNDPSKNRAIPTAEFKDCTVNGTVQIALNSDAYLSGATKIQLLDMEETSLVTLSNMKPGADITVLNEGVFTAPHESAAEWAEYFHAANANDLIDVKENALRYKVDYEGKLYPDAEGKAYCPVCKKIVVWTAVSSGESRFVAENGKHYYLTADILYEGEYSGNIAFFNAPSVSGSSVCLHLNGHNITSTKCHGIYGGYGVLNVMGEGVVTGYSGSNTRNAAVQINNRVASNALNLYSGTYRKSADSVAAAGVVGIENNGSRIRIYEDVDISNPGGTAIALGTSYINSNLEIYGATIVGNITVAAPSKANGDYKAILLFEDVTVNGEMTVAAGNEITLDGCTKINKLTIAAGQTVNFTNMLEGSDIAVSADGIFSGVMEKADEWLQYITCADEGDWVIVRDKQFYQEVKQEITAATDDDKTALNTTYAGTTIRYGEMHNHTNSGPYRDDGTGTSYSTGADGKNSLAEWIEEMDRLKMDFAFIVDHGMSIHMYHENFKSDYFIGGTEPGTTITDSKANPKSPHYNMLFADPAKLESIFFKWESKFKPVRWNLENYPNALTPSEVGYRVKYPSFTTEEFGQLAKDVYDAGGLLVQVHPKYDSYIYSNDPLDYYFADYSGFEITTGSGGNMMYKDNNEAYETWVDLLELDKKIWATAGSDRHRLPDISGMTVMYTVNDNSTDYMETVRAGNMAPGWIGIRMNVNGTAMGGETAFEGQRLQFSVGDIYNTGVKDYVNTPDPYVEGHTYRVELYDDGGLLMASTIDPTQMNYFAIDCDATAKFYRIVVWDETDNERIGVSNPIWNNAVVEE